MDLKFPVIEIFTSIQGEGDFQGQKATFIRFAGCNLRCPWCDTKSSWEKPCKHERIAYDSSTEMRSSDMHCEICGTYGSRKQLENLEVANLEGEEGAYKWLTSAEILAQIPNDPGVIILTGGEPTTVEGLKELVDAFYVKYNALHKDWCVAIETNGTNPVPDNISWITCSPKPPLYKINCAPDELKYVVDDNFHIGLIEERVKREMGCAIYLQVESAKPESAKRAYDMVMKHNAEFGYNRLRVGVQLHKLLEVR